MEKITRRELMQYAAMLGICLPIYPHIFPMQAAQGTVACPPTSFDRPVHPHGASSGAAAFIDPTATMNGGKNITLGQQVYIAPFAQLQACNAPIRIGKQTNIQDNVTIIDSFQRDDATTKRIATLGLHNTSGVEITEQCILAHGATVKGPAGIGIGGGNLPVFLSFGAEVDGAILEHNTVVSQLSRVGPGVRLHSGHVVLPGKNVTTQEEADNPSLGKVRLTNQADITFNEGVIKVNTDFANVYTGLFNEKASNIEGINYNPGNTQFNATRHLPTLNRTATHLPNFRNRIIGAVNLTDPLNHINTVMKDRISLRADEGEPFHVGHILQMSNNVIFHALEHTDLNIGNNITYGSQVIVHGGVRQPGNKQTVIEDNVTLKNQAIIFGSLIGRGSTIGEKSAILNSELAPGTIIPDRVIYLNNSKFGAVEW